MTYLKFEMSSQQLLAIHCRSSRFAGPFATAFVAAIVTAMAFAFSSAAHADDTTADECQLAVDASFKESAPRDSFHFANNAPKGWQIQSIQLDLEPSVGRLIFDTESGGKGVEVFQLFKVGNGTAVMADAALPGDGDSMLALEFEQFLIGDTFSFSIDVDDQLVNSSLGQIRVSGSEIAGAVIDIAWIAGNGQKTTQRWQFTDNSRGERISPEC